jgi:hypothetical protein
MIQFTDNSCDINLNEIVKPYSISNTEFLKYVLHNIKKNLGNRTVHLNALLSTPIGIPPYSGIVDMIVKQLDLPAHQIFVHTRDPEFFDHRVTKVDYDLWHEGFRKTCQEYFKDWEPQEVQENSKRFGALFGRIQLGRILLAHHLETVHGDQSIVSFLAGKMQLDHQIFRMESFFTDIKTWWDLRQNHEIFQKPDTDFGEFNWPRNLTTYPEVAKLFQIEMVSETDYCSIGNYTEKTWRCLAIGKPFILLNGAGSLANLRSLGFETFAPWINESYDSIPDLMARIDAIKNEITRLCNLSDDEWHQTTSALNSIAQRNSKFWHSWTPTLNFPHQHGGWWNLHKNV